MKRRLIYLSDAAIPSRSTNSMQTMRMCAAFAEAGAEVTLAFLGREHEQPEGYGGDVWTFYGVPATFELRALSGVPKSVLDQTGPLSQAARGLRFGVYVLSVLRRREPVIWYGRSLLAASVVERLRRLRRGRGRRDALVVELHDEPRARGVWRLLERVDGLVTITDALRRVVTAHVGNSDRIWVEADGADLDQFEPELDRAAARAALGLPAVHGPMVVYTGRVNRGKGVEVLLRAAPRLRALDAHLLVVGKLYVREYLELAPDNVTFTGFVPPADVPRYLAAADVLVLPSTSDLPYASYTSPLKLFEYMASGRTVVASGLPVLQEVLTHEQNALLYEPGDPEALALAVERLWADDELRAALAARASKDVLEFDWTSRARRILARL